MGVMDTVGVAAVPADALDAAVPLVAAVPPVVAPDPVVPPVAADVPPVVAVEPAEVPEGDTIIFTFAKSDMPAPFDAQ